MKKQVTGKTAVGVYRMGFKEAHKTPVIIVDSRKDLVIFGDDNQWYNNFPGYLIDLFNRSPKNSAIITGKLLYILGRGFRATGTMQQFVQRANSDESLIELTEKIALDFELFNGFYVEPVWNKLGTSIIGWRHLPFQNIRSNYNNSAFYYSERWSSVTTPKSSEVVKYGRYNIGDKYTGNRCLFFYHAYTPGMKVYPLPNYMGALAAIETDVEISNFNLNSIKNNLSVSKLVAIYGSIPSIEERKAFEKEFTDNKTGTDNAGQMLFAWSDNREKNVDVLDLSGNDLDKRYIQLNESIQQEIFTAHKVVSPMLFGVKTTGQLGGREELETAYEMFKNTYVNPRKMPILLILTKMCEAMGREGTLELIETEPVTKTAPVVQQPAAPQPAVQQKKQAFRDESRLIELFRKYGFNRDDLEILDTNYQWVEDMGGVVNTQLVKMSEAMALMTFATSIDDFDYAVMDYLKKDNTTPVNGIAAALGGSIDEVNASIEKLIEKGYLKATPEGVVVSKVGEKALSKNLPETSDTFIVYHYDVAPGLGAPIIPGTREFCRELVEMNKVYSRKDIEDISQEWGYSVWEFRGGFYHNPQTDDTTPFCRHIWTQEIVTKRS